MTHRPMYPPPSEDIVEHRCAVCGKRRCTYGDTPRGWVRGASGSYYCGTCTKRRKRPRRTP